MTSPFAPAAHAAPYRRFLPVTIDHSRINPETLEIAQRNAKLTPWETFPWRAGSPSCSTVYCHGQLWGILAIGALPPPFVETPYPPTTEVLLVGCDTDLVIRVTLDECRPADWTQADEDAYQLGPNGSVAEIKLTNPVVIEVTVPTAYWTDGGEA